MSTFEARVKDMFGGDAIGVNSVTSAASVAVPDGVSVLYVGGSTKIDFLYCNPSTRGRLLILVGDTSGTASLDNVDGAATDGQMDLGGSDVNVADSDVVVLLSRMDGTWVRVLSTDN